MSVEAEVQRLRASAGAKVLPEVRTLELSGPDRLRYLNGMVSNDVSLLQPGQGQLAVKPNNKGRVEGVLRIRATEASFLLDVLEPAFGAVSTNLEKFIIMDDCTLQDRSSQRQVIGLWGPKAAEVLTQLGAAPLPGAYGSFRQHDDAQIIFDDRMGIDGFELHVPDADPWMQKLSDAGAASISEEALEVLRVEAGVPVDGQDIDDDTIPMEARLEAALNFKKGCYVGQEVIARATNLGGVKHILVGLQITGDEKPAVGSAIHLADDKVTGELTSVVFSPTLGKLIGLGYVRKADEAPGTKLKVVSGDVSAEAVISGLPFVA